MPTGLNKLEHKHIMNIEKRKNPERTFFRPSECLKNCWSRPLKKNIVTKSVCFKWKSRENKGGLNLLHSTFINEVSNSVQMLPCHEGKRSNFIVCISPKNCSVVFVLSFVDSQFVNIEMGSFRIAVFIFCYLTLSQGFKISFHSSVRSSFIPFGT